MRVANVGFGWRNRTLGCKLDVGAGWGCEGDGGFGLFDGRRLAVVRREVPGLMCA